MPNVFDNSRQVLINGKVVDSIVTATGGVLYSRLPSSFLSIDVPLNLVYSDAFLINGTLTDKNNEGIVGETVNLLVGSTVVDSTTTTTNGAYSFTQTPVSTGNHTFQVVYDGSEEYSGSESSIVERVVGKETTVLSLTTPTDNSSVYTDGSISVSGSLVTDDNEKLSNKSIVVKEGNTTITTFTTNSNGVFTGSITGLNVGTHSLTFQFVSDSNYTGSSVSRTVIVNNHMYSLSLTANKNIISSEESSIITALLIKDGVGYSGQSLSYTIKHGSTTITSGTTTTNSNGQAPIIYTGTGAGDVEVIVSYGSLLQETYEVQDCIRYDDATTDKTSNYQYNNLNSHTFSTDKYIAQRTIGSSPASTYYSPIYPSDTLPTDYEISVDIFAPTKEVDMQFGLCVSDEYTQTYSGTNQCFLYANYNRTTLGYRVNGSLTNYGESSSYNANTWYTFKITVNGTSVSSQVLNGSTVVQSWNGTLSNIQSWKKIMIITGGQANTVHWKNLKIKAL